jgi:hypothetical protein
VRGLGVIGKGSGVCLPGEKSQQTGTAAAMKEESQIAQPQTDKARQMMRGLRVEWSELEGYEFYNRATA